MDGKGGGRRGWKVRGGCGHNGEEWGSLVGGVVVRGRGGRGDGDRVKRGERWWEGEGRGRWGGERG